MTKSVGIVMFCIAACTGLYGAYVGYLISQDVLAMLFSKIEPWEVSVGIYSGVGAAAVGIVVVVLALMNKTRASYTIGLSLPVAGLVSLFAFGTLPLIVGGVFGLIGALLLKKHEGDQLLLAIDDEMELSE